MIDRITAFSSTPVGHWLIVPIAFLLIVVLSVAGCALIYYVWFGIEALFQGIMRKLSRQIYIHRMKVLRRTNKDLPDSFFAGLWED